MNKNLEKTTFFFEQPNSFISQRQLSLKHHSHPNFNQKSYKSWRIAEELHPPLSQSPVRTTRMNENERTGHNFKRPATESKQKGVHPSGSVWGYEIGFFVASGGERSIAKSLIGRTLFDLLSGNFVW
jgi:hypothetical protein